MNDVDDYGQDELTGLAEHEAFHYSTPDEWHAAWHHENRVPMGQPGCPQDACDGDDADYGPAWKGVEIDSPNLCDGPPPAEPPF